MALVPHKNDGSNVFEGFLLIVKCNIGIKFYSSILRSCLILHVKAEFIIVSEIFFYRLFLLMALPEIPFMPCFPISFIILAWSLTEGIVTY